MAQIHNLLKELDTSKAIELAARNIDHPDGKKSRKTGKVLKVTQFTQDFTVPKKGNNAGKKVPNSDATWIEASEVKSLTIKAREYNALGLSGIIPKQTRWFKDDFTTEIAEQCKLIRGKLKASELYLDILELKTKMDRATKNPEIQFLEEIDPDSNEVRKPDIELLYNKGSKDWLEGIGLLRGSKVQKVMDVAF